MVTGVPNSIRQAKNDEDKAAAILDQVRLNAMREIVSAQMALRTSLAESDAAVTLKATALTSYDATLDSYKQGDRHHHGHCRRRDTSVSGRACRRRCLHLRVVCRGHDCLCDGNSRSGTAVMGADRICRDARSHGEERPSRELAPALNRIIVRRAYAAIE